MSYKPLTRFLKPLRTTRISFLSSYIPGHWSWIYRSILVLLFLVFLFFAQNLMLSLGMICKDNEREALLSIKQDLKELL